MTVLIDPPNWAGHGRMWSHLASDTSFEELHRFAASTGVPSRGFERDHYDIPADHYDRMVAAGAAPVTSRELLDRLVTAGLRRRKADTLTPKMPGRSLVRARRLRPGDRVAVTSPAGPVRPERLEAGLAVLTSWGLDVRLMPNVRHRHEHFSYLSSSDAERAADFMRAWCDPSVAAVFCARGGYGAQRIADLLDWDAVAAAGAKVLVGFSDVTALHQAFAARLGASTVHGPVVTSLGTAEEPAREQLRRVLLEPEPGLSLTAEPVEPLVSGRARGVLVGGNVALLASCLGTADSRPAAQSIAVLEDIGEQLYRLDRMLTQLLRAGWFHRVGGIALGRFTDCGEPSSVRRLLEDRLGPLGVPMLWGLPFGHDDGNLAFPFGVPAELDADAGTLTLREAPLL